MSKTFKIVVLVLVILTSAAVVWFRNMQAETRKHSPQTTLQSDALGLQMVYCSPAVKGRAIFGGLVPYNEVWRTGANEATTFDTQNDLVIGGQKLSAGKYTFWTIPGETEWQLIWNSGAYGWGVSWGGKASRKPEKDVLTVKVPAQKLPALQENFSITLAENPSRLQLAWENTLVEVPVEKP